MSSEETNSKTSSISLSRKEWLLVTGAFCSITPYAGTLGSYGVVVGSIENEFNTTSLVSSWIGSLAFGFTVGTCPVSTALYALYGPKKILIWGVFQALISLYASSFANSAYLLFFTYSFGYGVACNFLYNTYMNLIGDFLEGNHLAFGSVFASFGVSVGVLAMNPLASWVAMRVGWRNVWRIFGAIVFVTNLTCALMLPDIKMSSKVEVEAEVEREGGKQSSVEKPSIESDNAQVKENKLSDNHLKPIVDSNDASTSESRQLDKENSSKATVASRVTIAMRKIKSTIFPRKAIDTRMFSNPTFWLWMLATLSWSVAFLFPLIFLVEYQQVELGVDKSDTAWPLTVYGVSELIGRIVTALVADKLPFSMAYAYSFCSLIGCVMAAVTPLGKNLATVYVYSCVVGLVIGLLNSLIFAATTQFFGSYVGFYAWSYVNVMLAVGMVTGPVVAGALYDVTRSYDSAFFVAAGFLGLSFVLCLLIPLSMRVEKKKKTEDDLK